jgi:hypothetical protein
LVRRSAVHSVAALALDAAGELRVLDGPLVEERHVDRDRATKASLFVVLQVHIRSAERAFVTNKLVEHLPCTTRLRSPPSGFLSLSVPGIALFVFLLLLKQTVLLASLLWSGQEARERGLLDRGLGLLRSWLGRGLLGWRLH